MVATRSGKQTTALPRSPPPLPSSVLDHESRHNFPLMPFQAIRKKRRIPCVPHPEPKRRKSGNCRRGKAATTRTSNDDDDEATKTEARVAFAAPSVAVKKKASWLDDDDGANNNDTTFALGLAPPFIWDLPEPVLPPSSMFVPLPAAPFSIASRLAWRQKSSGAATRNPLSLLFSPDQELLLGDPWGFVPCPTPHPENALALAPDRLRKTETTTLALLLFEARTHSFRAARSGQAVLIRHAPNAGRTGGISLIDFSNAVSASTLQAVEAVCAARIWKMWDMVQRSLGHFSDVPRPKRLQDWLTASLSSSSSSTSLGDFADDASVCLPQRCAAGDARDLSLPSGFRMPSARFVFNRLPWFVFAAGMDRLSDIDLCFLGCRVCVAFSDCALDGSSDGRGRQTGEHHIAAGRLPRVWWEPIWALSSPVVTFASPPSKRAEREKREGC